MHNLRKIQLTGFGLAGLGAILILSYLLMEAQWIVSVQARMAQGLGVALVVIGAALNVYAYQQATEQQITK